MTTPFCRHGLCDDDALLEALSYDDALLQGLCDDDAILQGLCDDDALLQAGSGWALYEGWPEVGGDGLAGQVGAVEAHVQLAADSPRLILDTVARALKHMSL